MKVKEMKSKQKQMEKYIIEQYQKDEKTMVLIFAQWCINNNLDPVVLYKEAYPTQLENHLLKEVIDETVSKEESEYISHEIVLQVLQYFGNDDLAFVVQNTVEKNKNNSRV